MFWGLSKVGFFRGAGFHGVGLRVMGVLGEWDSSSSGDRVL